MRSHEEHRRKARWKPHEPAQEWFHEELRPVIRAPVRYGDLGQELQFDLTVHKLPKEASMRRILIVSCVVVVAACNGGSPSGPSSAVPQNPAAADSGAGTLRNTSSTDNNPPAVVLRTTPHLVNGVVAGFLPLDVHVNLCRSSDPDQGDSLRYDVDWGDGVETGPDDPGAGTDPENGGPSTGCGGPDCCRHRHRFDRNGAFTVTARVSDKPLRTRAATYPRSPFRPPHSR